MIVTVFKDELKWSSDLKKKADQLGARQGNSAAWEQAKELTSKVDFTQRINLHPSFFVDIKGKRRSEGAIISNCRDIAYNIAAGRNFKIELS